MPKNNFYRNSRLSFLSGFNIKRLKRLCERELNEALRDIDRNHGNLKNAEKQRLEIATEASEFIDAIQNPDNPFSWSFYERLAKFRDFLGTLSNSVLFDDFEKKFLHSVYSSIPQGDLDKNLTDDQILPYKLPENERVEILQNLKNLLAEKGLDASWLENLPLQDILIRNAPKYFLKKNLPPNDTAKTISTPRALYLNGSIHYNNGTRPDGSEGFDIDSPEGMVFLLHELRHCWQSQNPNWSERYQGKDIGIETDAFERQVEFEKTMNLRIPSDSSLINFFDNAETESDPFLLKSRHLWDSRGYGCPDKNYTFPDHKPFCNPHKKGEEQQ